MRVIVWGINYAPELTGIAPFNTGLCDYLQERGHSVEMVTTFPYYPFWKKIPGDTGQLYRADDFDGVWVHRCWHYVPARVSTLRRMAHELSFGVTSFFRVLFLARPDVFVIVSPPLLLGPLASLMGWFKRRPYVFHVQDLQPDAAVGLGMVKVGLLTRMLYRVEAWCYRDAALVSGISAGMLAAYERKGVPAEKRVLFPNWLRSYGRNVALTDTEAERQRHAQKFRQKFKISDRAFVASYSGNLGRKQGLETLVQAAGMLAADGGSGRQIVILIIGDGAMRAELEAQIASLGLTNIGMMPLLIEADYHGMLAGADVSLILQAPGTGQYFFPSKLLSVLAARSPIVSVADADSELAKAVDEGQFGINIPPADPKKLADTLQRLAANPNELHRLRENTKWVQRFEGPRVLGDFEARLRAVAER